jgi:hypothetical protein
MASYIGRRKFLATLGGAAVAWPLAARAQQAARVPRIGIVDDAPMWHSFRQALREFRYVEGQSINYEYRYSEGMPDRLATVVGELVRRPVDLIAAYGTPPTEAAKGGDDDNPDRDDRRRRSGARWLGGEPRPPGWQHHGQYRA